MAEDRVFIERKEERSFIDRLKEENILGFASLENIDIYILFAALGNDTPTEFAYKDGYVRVDGDRNTELKAKLSSFLLSSCESDDEIDKNAVFKTCIEYADQCSYSGFVKFRDLYNSSEGEDAFIKKLEIQLNNLYSQYFD